jgi:transcriptional regulator with XRE-family HTH domain
MRPTAKQFRDFLETHRYTQAEIAERLGVTRDAVASYVNGRVRFPERLLPRLRALGFADASATISVAREAPAAYVTTVAIRAWRGALASAPGDDGEFTPDDYQEVLTAFVVGGMERADLHDFVRVRGTSLEPRVRSGGALIIYRDPGMSLVAGRIYLCEDDGGRVYVKVLRRSTSGERFELHALRDGGARFDDITGWQIHGYAVAIIHDDDEPGANVEWRGGRPLTA